MASTAATFFIYITVWEQIVSHRCRWKKGWTPQLQQCYENWNQCCSKVFFVLWCSWGLFAYWMFSNVSIRVHKLKHRCYLCFSKEWRIWTSTLIGVTKTHIQGISLRSYFRQELGKHHIVLPSISIPPNEQNQTFLYQSPWPKDATKTLHRLQYNGIQLEDENAMLAHNVCQANEIVMIWISLLDGTEKSQEQHI